LNIPIIILGVIMIIVGGFFLTTPYGDASYYLVPNFSISSEEIFLFAMVFSFFTGFLLIINGLKKN